jgi:hypothetical protein
LVTSNLYKYIANRYELTSLLTICNKFFCGIRKIGNASRLSAGTTTTVKKKVMVLQRGNASLFIMTSGLRSEGIVLNKI